MVQAQKIYPINLLHSTYPMPIMDQNAEWQQSALYLSPTDNNMMQAQKVLFTPLLSYSTKRHNTARLGFATSNIDAPETPQSLMKED